jgi:mannose-6-phosphate isomerase-like protein (cupin superfamily)
MITLGASLPSAIRQSPAMSINLAAKLSTFSEHWQPRVVSTFNGHDVMVAKLKGEFNWHKHDDTDDFFLVLKGTLVLQLRDRDITLREGEMFVVPTGVEHRPIANEEVHLMLIERSGTPNTGDPATAAPRRVI